MIVRCGRCGSQFDVAEPGRYSCPACGTVNDVRSAGDSPPPPVAPPAPQDEPAPPRVTCDDCGFAFIVGAVESAPCPNCGNPVTVSPREV